MTLSIACSEVRRAGRVVLQPFDVTLPRAGCTALVGVNGAGKTTLLMALADVLRQPRCCRVRLDAADNDGRRVVGFAPQRPTFPAWLTVVQCARLFGVAFDDLCAAFPDLQFDELADARAGKLSVGQTQALSIALALHTRAPLILLDEPFAPLDFHRRIGLTRVIRTAAERSAVIVSSQSATEILDVSDWIVVLKGGRPVFNGAISELDGVLHNETAARDPALRREIFERQILSML